jgi:phenylacetate-CoA ligase
MRREIEEVFQSPVFDFYGSREVGPLAGQCRRGRLHVFNFNNVVEVVDRAGCPVGKGQEGQILVTNLHNRAMPLIRYAIGDSAVMAAGCDCGSKLPAFEKVTGRVTDHFLTRGGLVHGEFFTHLFYHRRWLREFQVLQSSIDEVIVYVVLNERAPQAEVGDIERQMRVVMGDECRIDWVEVDEVPRTPQGKFLFTRSLISGGDGDASGA